MSKQCISNYDKYPQVRLSESPCRVGWKEITEALKGTIKPGSYVVCVECYPGCFEDEIARELVQALQPRFVALVRDCYLPPSAIESITARDLGDDPVFAFMNKYELSEFLDGSKLAQKRDEMQSLDGLKIVIGAGASLLVEKWDLLIYCDMARWEIQQRQRAGRISNLGLENEKDRPSLKYKRAYFIDWRVADRLK